MSGLAKITRLAAKAYSKQPLRFLVVGGWNTAFGYLAFALLYYLFSPRVHYLAIQVVCMVLAITNAYLCYKFFVFRTRGNYLREYFRFYTVYAVPSALGLLLLPFAIEVLKMNAYLAQALATFIIAVISYLGHKHFSFRASKDGERNV